MASESLYTTFPDLGDKVGVFCQGYGTSIWMCCSLTQTDPPSDMDSLELLALSMGKTIVVIEELTRYVYTYNEHGAGYVFLLQYDEDTYGLIVETTEDGQLRTVFPKAHSLYSRVLSL
jgi:hypothetical protein